MRRILKNLFVLLLAALLLTGCAMPTMDELYCLPKRSSAYNDLQMVIEEEMENLSYSAPISGENQQTVQSADLDGDGLDEYLLFAKNDSEKPLKILIFSQVATGYVLMDTIEGNGFAFEFVDYAQLDDRPGLEIVVGRQLSDRVARSVSVYRFTSGSSRQLMSGTYTRMVAADFDDNGVEELLLISPGQTDESNAVAVLYAYRDGQMCRSEELDLSAPASSLKRATLGKLEDGGSAVFVSSGPVDNAILTDVLTVGGDRVSLLEKGISSGSLSNYYLYADDVDNDGVIELPTLMDMKPAPGAESAAVQKLVKWYSVDSAGGRKEKLHAYYNHGDGWYLRLKKQWAESLSVTQTEDIFTFYLWDDRDSNAERVFSIHLLTGLDREEQAKQEGMIILHKNDTAIYVAQLTAAAAQYGITETTLKNSFSLIRADWNTEESEGDKK